MSRLYYKVKPQYDQKRRVDGSIYIANELYTEKEVEKLRLDTQCLLPVMVNRTYWCFGARFESEEKYGDNF